eukprot:scaffold4213_cov193-Chaetoceros_neogracile.AAC.1
MFCGTEDATKIESTGPLFAVHVCCACALRHYFDSKLFTHYALRNNKTTGSQNPAPPKIVQEKSIVTIMSSISSPSHYEQIPSNDYPQSYNDQDNEEQL